MKMHSLRSASLLMLLVLGLRCPTSNAALPTAVGSERLPTLAPMVEKVTPTVVNIATRGRVPVENLLLNDPFFRRFFDVPQQYQRMRGLGSGVIIDANHGYIVTNYHVIEHADDIQVTLHDGRQIEAEVIGSDSQVDVAVIRVKAKRLTSASIANPGALRVGDFVVAIGNPFGLGQTVTSGIVSALERSGLGIEAYENFIQTDASINPGNSGGALVNLRGELVGINTAILGPNGGNIGIGFAIPTDMVREIAAQLIKFAKVWRGELGVVTQDLTPELANAFGIHLSHGVVIARVETESPAARAGLKPGDIVVSVNGHRAEDATALHNVIGLLTVGDSVRMNVLRNGRVRTVEAMMGERAANTVQGSDLSAWLAGSVLSNLKEDWPLYGMVTGVLVKQVKTGSLAARASLRAGDVILSINQQPVKNVDDIKLALNNNPSQLLLNVRRGNSRFFILLR